MSHRRCTRTPCYSLRLRTPALFLPFTRTRLYGLAWCSNVLVSEPGSPFLPWIEGTLTVGIIGRDQPSHDDAVAWWSVWTILSINDTPVGYLLEAASTQWRRGGVWKTWKQLILVSMAVFVQHYQWGCPDHGRQPGLAWLRWTKPAIQVLF